VRDLLYRFRPAGGPGSATPAGVPADRERDLAAELEPVFAALAPTVARCRELVEDGRREADGVRARDALAVEHLAAALPDRVAAARAQGRAEVLAEADSQGARVEADAAARASRLEDRLTELLPSYRGQVAASVEALLTTAPGPSGGDR
jgi:hypothetical protein